MQQEPLTLRTFKTGVVVTIGTAALLCANAQGGWAAGFAIGAALSLFSFISLCILVPMVLFRGAPGYMRGLLGLTLFMKLPLYAVGLYMGTHLHGVKPVGMVLGIALMPAVISLKTVGQMLVGARKLAVAQEQVPLREQPSLVLETRPLPAARPVHAEPIREGV